MQEAGKAKVLVCDDSKLVRVTAKKMLASKFDLVLAVDGEDAWEKLQQDPGIQVVFTDLGMPKLDGFGLIEKVRQCQNDKINQIPLIVITGAKEDESVKKRIFDIGATDFITKPFKATELVARADTHIQYQRTKDNLTAHTNIDPGTGVLNKQAIIEQLVKDQAFAQRHKEHLVMCLLSLDNFDAWYKKLGERNVQLVMKQTASLFRSILRQEDSIGRYSKGDFMVCLPATDQSGASDLLQRLINKVTGLKLKLGSESVQLSMSVGGCASSRDEALTHETFISKANNALQEARKLGQGHVIFAPTQKAIESIDDLSVDKVVDDIVKGHITELDDRFPAIALKLKPLLNLLTVEQKQIMLR